MNAPYSHFLTAVRRAALPAIVATGLIASPAFGATAAEPMTFFPPVPPILGQPIRTAPMGADARGRGQPPEGLADFTSEYLYPALATRLHHGTLTEDLQRRLDRYRDSRATLLNELLDRMIELDLAGDAEREREFALLAARQSAPILALEHEAEALRRELVSGGLLQRSVSWNAGRRWKFGNPPHNGPGAEFEVIRAAAFYEDGFSAEQRGLLCELAIELNRTVQRSLRPQAMGSGIDPATIYFAPERSAFLPASDLPPALRQKFGVFNGRKAALKRELQHTVYEQDRAPAGQRTRAFEALADRQWPELTALAELAEDIRRELAALPSPQPPGFPRLPDALVRRIEGYHQQRYVLGAELRHRITERETGPIPPPSSYSPAEKSAWIERMQSALVEDRKRVIEEFRERYERLERDYRIAIEELTELGKIFVDPATGEPISAERLWQTYLVGWRYYDTRGREEVIYKHYKMAMLMPGLSREQRRLLFGVAVVKLAQPLPRGERLPKPPLLGVFR